MNKKLAFPSLPLSGAHCSVYLGILRQQTQMIAADKERREKIGVVGRRGEANLLLGKSGINYKHHAIDSQGRLGDVCWHDNLWKWEQMGSEMIHPGCLEGLTRPQTLVLDPVSKIFFTSSSCISANPSWHAIIQIQRTGQLSGRFFCWHLKTKWRTTFADCPSIQKCCCAIKKCSSFWQWSSSEIIVTLEHE